MFKLNNPEPSIYGIKEEDYLDQLSQIGGIYLRSENIVELPLSDESKTYVKNIYMRLIRNNEMLFAKDDVFQLHVIKNKSPFLFALPKGEVFISSGLFERYLKSEDLFVAALSSEILKSKRNLFEKKLMIPLGFISTERVLKITKVSPDVKKSINEWSYVILKRAGFDATSYLNWIQLQNRNSLEFALYLSDSINISNEEQQFKNFMSKQGIDVIGRKLSEANSSKDYYKLLKNIYKESNETRTVRKNSSGRTI